MTIDEIPFYMARALILTVLVETLIAFFIGYRKKDLLNVVLVNIMTNPTVFIVPVYFNIKYGLLERNVVLFILEILAVLSEGFVYDKYFENRKMNGYVLSLILNLSTYLLGVIINNL